MTIFGWDASDFDWDRGPMDLAAARRDGIDFFTHKATEGTSTKHRRFGEAVTRARTAGVPFIGAYGIPRSAGSIAAQVDYFLSYVDSQAPWWRAYPGWFFQCDLEHWSYDAVPPARGVEWCRLVRERTGRQVLLYAPRWAYSDSIGGADPLWQSAYGSNPVGHYRALYPGDTSSRWAKYSGRTPQVLQYGSRATIGTQGTCDANAFRGDVSAFAHLIGARTTPIDGEDDMVNTWTEAVTQNAGRQYLNGQQRDTVLAIAAGGASDANAGVQQLLVAAQADEVRDKAVLAAIEALAAGGGVDAAPIVDAVNRVRDEARARFADLAAAVGQAEARAAAAEAEIVQLRAQLAAGLTAAGGALAAGSAA